MIRARKICLVVALAQWLAVLPGRPAHAEDLIVFAAASLKESMTEAADAFAAKGSPKPLLSFAASSLLARQIENGAPANVFVSADEQWMDELVKKSRIAAGTRTSFLGNRLVLVASARRPFTMEIKFGFALAELLGTDKLAMADPDSVPAGKYGKAALSNLGVWSQVEGSVVRSDNVRAALMLVERDEARAGIVYATDALVSRSVIVVGTFPEISHQPISYPLGIVADHDTPDARALRAFLLSEEGKAIFRKHGFITR